MMEKAPYSVKQVSSDTWIIEEEGVRFFLLAGIEKALLIDSGMMVPNGREIAESLTSLPLSLLNTHADRDHIAGNEAFSSFYMSPAEADNLRFGSGGRLDASRILPVREGDVIDLGGRDLKIIEIPGHTPGSIAVLDENNRVLISGDPIQDGRIFMFGPARDMKTYLDSLLKVKYMAASFDEIWPSHGSLPVKAELIDALYEKGLLVFKDELPHTEASFHGMELSVYDVGCAAFLMDRR